MILYIRGLGEGSFFIYCHYNLIATLHNATYIINDRLPLLKDDFASWNNIIQALYNHANVDYMPLKDPTPASG